MKEQIEFSEFLEIEKKLEITIGKIEKVEDVPKSDKLIKLTVNFGDETKTVVTNIKPYVTKSPEGKYIYLEGQCFPFITNLKPVKMMGIESHGMIMPGTEIESGNMLLGVNALPGLKIL